MSDEKKAQKTTGQTPEAIEDIPGRQVLRVAEVKFAMVGYVESEHPTPVTRLVAIQPGGRVTFIDDDVIGKPAQAWFSAAVVSKLSGS